jgi:putative multiple sugar transport system substrate-binding protein
MNLKTLAAAVAVGLLTAGSVAYAQDKGTIGLAMPTKTSARWIADHKGR